MIEQGNRTQQLIYRTSYRKHKERLADIRPNITANDFLPPRNHQSAKKQSQKVRTKRDEPQSGNFYMKSKLSALKNRANGKIDELFSTEQLRKQPRRYFDHSNEVKVQMNSEINEVDNVKFVLPTQKNPSASFNAKIKDGQKVDITVAQTKLSSIEKSYKKFSSNSVVRDTQRDIKTAKQPELFYNLPERNENRVVIYKKTLVFSSMQSCLLQLSLINDRLLIAAYLMGLQNTTLRQLYSLKKTGQILKQCQSNYQQLCSRIVIQKANEKYLFIRIIPKQEENKQKQDKQQDKSKQKSKIQNEFIKRNYYTLVKNEQETKQEPKENKPIFTFDHVQAIVDRLAVPKRFFKQREQKIDKPKAVSTYQKGSNSYQLSHQQLVRPEKRSSIQASKQSINRQKEEKMVKTSQKSAHNQSYLSQKKSSIQKIENKSIVSKQQQKNAEQNYDEEYEQQFDNPSQVKNSKIHSLQASKHINNSLLSNKSKISKELKQSTNKPKQKNQSQVYDHQFENQAEQQYEQLFENNNESQSSPVAKIANNSSIPVSNVEEEYEEEFAD